MSRENLPVIAAIPNYNMAEPLSTLLPQITEQGYDDIYILDDASTDHSREVAEPYGSDIHFIAGEENVGSGGNRNRIMHALGHQAIIHFIDADMLLETPHIPEIAKEVMRPEAGFVGGLVKELDGTQMIFNYGPRQSLRNDLGVPLHLQLFAIGSKRPQLEQRLRQHYSKILDAWPNPRGKIEPKKVFWVSEANMLTDSKTFEAVGGYDPKLRDHDIQDLAIRLHKCGYSGYFEPSISAVHTAAQVRQGNRNSSMASAELYIARKHGLLQWLTAK